MTTTSASPDIATGAAPITRKDLPVRVFRAVVAVIVVFVLTGPGGAVDLLAPVTLAFASSEAAELHRWHMIDLAAYLSLLTVGALLVVAWRPRQSVVVMQTVLLSLAGFGALGLTTPVPGEILVPVGIVGVLLVASFPSRRRLTRIPSLRMRSPLALLGAVAVTPYLVVNLVENVTRQVGGAGPHAELGHWAGAAAVAFGLLLTAWVATTDVGGARGLAMVVAVTLTYLAVSALVHRAYDGAWAGWGAVSALVGALLFVASARRAPEGSTR